MRISMPVSEGFTEYILDQLSPWGGVTSRKMFGGVGLYRDGKMFGLLADDVIYLKVDDTNLEKFVEAGSAPFKPFANKPTTMSYYDVPGDIMENPDDLIDWAEESLAIQMRQK